MFYGKKTSQQQDNTAEPLCRFGPGGDFVWSWRPELNDLEQTPSRPFFDLIRCAIQTLTSFLSPELINENNRNICRSLLIHSKENISDKFADRRCSHVSDTEEISAPEINTPFSREPMLFPDFRGTGIKAWHKPKHGVRAHRRVTKKRTSVSLPGQGTLFDPNAQSARTA
jgi:hypothetical protein